MNRQEAFRQDREFYVEHDSLHSSYGTFGDQTGFCYLLSYHEHDCRQEAERLEEMKAREIA